MRTHLDVLASLSPAEKAALTQRSDRKGLTHLAVHLGLILALGTAIAAQVPFWPLLMLPQGVLLVFLFTLSHECTHHTPFQSRWLSDAVGHLVAPLLGLPFIWFRYFHFAHHKHTNDPARDPELAGGGRPSTWGQYALYLSGWGYWSGNARTLVQNAFGRIDAPYLPPRKHAAMRREARVILALYAVAALSLIWTPVLLCVWVLPVLIGQPVLRAYLLAEHGLCPPVADMLENSRTTKTGSLIRALAWNMPYHAEHHAFPAVPFHALPAFHAVVAGDLKSVSPGYSRFTADYLREMRQAN